MPFLWTRSDSLQQKDTTRSATSPTTGSDSSANDGCVAGVAVSYDEWQMPCGRTGEALPQRAGQPLPHGTGQPSSSTATDRCEAPALRDSSAHASVPWFALFAGVDRHRCLQIVGASRRASGHRARPFPRACSIVRGPQLRQSWRRGWSTPPSPVVASASSVVLDADAQDDKDSSSLAAAPLERSSSRAVRIRASRAVVQRH